MLILSLSLLLLLLSPCESEREKGSEPIKEDIVGGRERGGEREREGAEREREVRAGGNVAALVVAESALCLSAFLSQLNERPIIGEIPIFVGLPPSFSLSPSLYPSLSIVTVAFPSHFSPPQIHNGLIEEIATQGFTFVVVFCDIHLPVRSTNVTRLIDAIERGEGEIASAKGCLDKDFCYTGPRSFALSIHTPHTIELLPYISPPLLPRHTQTSLTQRTHTQISDTRNEKNPIACHASSYIHTLYASRVTTLLSLPLDTTLPPPSSLIDLMLNAHRKGVKVVQCGGVRIRKASSCRVGEVIKNMDADADDVDEGSHDISLVSLMRKWDLTTFVDGSGRRHSLPAYPLPLPPSPSPSLSFSLSPSLSPAQTIDWNEMDEEEKEMLIGTMISLANSAHLGSAYYKCDAIQSITKRRVNSVMDYYSVEAKVVFDQPGVFEKDVKLKFIDTHRSHVSHLDHLRVLSVWKTDLIEKYPIYFVTSSKENSRYLVRLVTQIEDMRDDNVNLVIVDYDSKDMDVTSLRKSPVVRDIITIKGNFSRAGGLDIGIKRVKEIVEKTVRKERDAGEILIFAVDSSMLLPRQLPSLIRRNTKRGVCVFAPVCLKFDKYLPDSVTASGDPVVSDDNEALLFRNGHEVERSDLYTQEKHWVYWGYGMIGMAMRDYFDVGGYDVEKWGDRWGLEDVDLVERFHNRNIKLIRPKLRAYFHLQRKGNQLLSYRMNKNSAKSLSPHAPYPIIYRHGWRHEEISLLLEAIYPNQEMDEVDLLDAQYYPSMYAGSANGYYKLTYSLNEETHSTLIVTSFGPILISESDSRNRASSDPIAFNKEKVILDPEVEKLRHKRWMENQRAKRKSVTSAASRDKERESRAEKMTRLYEEQQMRVMDGDQKGVTQSHIVENVTLAKENKLVDQKRRASSYWNKRFNG